MRTSENVVKALVRGGLLPEALAGAAEDMVEDVTHDDFIPGGPECREARRLRVNPGGHRCGVRIGEDVQSGPFYCGKAATLVADGEGGVVAACGRHEGVIRSLVPAAEWDEVMARRKLAAFDPAI